MMHAPAIACKILADATTCPATGATFGPGDVAVEIATPGMQENSALLKPTDMIKLVSVQCSLPRGTNTCAVTQKTLEQGAPVFVFNMDSTMFNNKQPAKRATRATRSAKSDTRNAQQTVACLVMSTAGAGSLLGAVLTAANATVDDIQGFKSLKPSQQDDIRAEFTGITAPVVMDASGNDSGNGLQSDMESIAQAQVRLMQRDGSESEKLGSGSEKIGDFNRIASTSSFLTTDDELGTSSVYETEFERLRAQQIARNRSRMVALELPSLGAAVAPKDHSPHRERPPRAKGIGSQKRARSQTTSEEAPRRASLRQRKVAPDAVLAAGVEAETNRGGILLAARAGISSIWGPHNGPMEYEKEEPRERHPTDELTNKQYAMKQVCKKFGVRCLWHSLGPVAFRSEYGSETTDKKFLEYLKTRLTDTESSAATRQSSGKTSKSHQDKKTCVGLHNASKLSLADTDYAKVVKDGVSHLAWHPDASHLLVASGDKTGRISLWQVDYPAPHHESTGSKKHKQGDEEEAEFDGVAVFANVHKSYISGLQWMSPPGSSSTSCSHLLTASYDGSLRLLDVQQETFQDLSAGIREDMEISATEVDQPNSIAYIADNIGNLEIVDIRAGSAVRPGLLLHDKRVNSLHLEPLSRRLLVSSGSDAHVRVWDVRMLSKPHTGGGKPPTVKPLCEINHNKSCHAAYWAPDGSQRVLSTSYDDTLRIWSPAAGSYPLPAGATASTTTFARAGSGRKSHGGDLVAEGDSKPAQITLSQSVRIHHNNQTGRWVTPFRAVWGPAADVVACGNMKRGVDLFNATTGAQVAILNNELMTAIPSRLALHPYVPVLAAATSSGRVYVWR